MNTLLIIDLETTGLKPETDSPIELGAILYSIPDHCTIQQISTLFSVMDNPAENINRISAKASQTIFNK
jgi:DNA polymerase-3 subunit epsilon